MALKSWRRYVLNVVLDAPSGNWVSLEPIRLVPVSVSNTQLLGGQVAATPGLSSKHPPAVAGVTLHELWYEFGDTVNGAKTKEGSNGRIQMESSETKSKAREAGVLQLPPFPRKITVLPLNLLLACVSPDILLLLFEFKKKVCFRGCWQRRLNVRKKPIEVCSNLDFCISFE